MKAVFGAAVIGATALFGASALAQSDEVVTLKISYQFPEHHFVTVGCIDPFIDGVEERLPGRVKFERYPAQQLAKAINQLDSVRNRVADIAMHNTAYTPQLTPLATFLELPGMFGFSDTLNAQRAYERLANAELMELEFEKLGVVPAWVFITSPYQFQMASFDPVTDVKQLEGKKLRVPGAGAEMAVDLVGAVGVRVPASDLYLALQRGTVDGSIISTSALPAYKLDEVVGAISTNASWGASPFIAAMHKDRWAGLPDDVREAVADAGKAAGEHCARVYMDLESKENARLKEMGKTLFELPDSALADLERMLQPVRDHWLEQMDQRSLPGEMVIAKFKEYLKEEQEKQ